MNLYKTMYKLIILLASIGLLFSFSNKAIAEPSQIDSYGIWTIESLGCSDYDFPCIEDTEISIPIDFCLSDNASQGPDDWYIIHLDFTISISEQSGEGRCYLSALTNGFACSQIKFETKRENCSLITDWSSVDLINGGIHHSTSSNLIDVSSDNYLQNSGVKPGLNQLTFKLEQYEDIKIDKLKILNSTSIEHTKASPPELILGVNIPDRSINIGDVFSVAFQVKNLGDKPAKDVEVSTQCSGGGLVLDESHSTTVASLDSSLNGTFKYTAIKEGTHYITIFVETKSGVFCSPMNIKVPISSPVSFPPPILTSTLIIVAALLVVVIIVHRSKLKRIFQR